MNTDFSVSISICDSCRSKCCNSFRQIERILTSTSDFISLQNSFTLRILSVTSTYIIITITNDEITFVRRLFVRVPILICMPNCSAEHILRIQANSI